jgi:hypothetical protein
MGVKGKAAVRMMKNITRFEKKVPVQTSSLRSDSSRRVALRRQASSCRPLAWSSSTSWLACQ